MNAAHRPSLCIVTPALADANNGNWQTARRWARALAGHWRVRLAPAWPDAHALAGGATDALLALHARRSASSVAAWEQAQPRRPLVVVLTGTDLYRDIASDAAAQESLALADRLVVLQPQGLLALPEPHRSKAVVVLQSTTARATLPKTRAHLRAVMVGHLRDEKWPQTLFEAARLIGAHEGIRIDHMGLALDAALAEAAQATAAVCPHYRWLGGLPRAQVRERIQRAHVLVHTSRLEGGAHVLMEAVCSGTPVLASRVAGNVGMLGADHAGYFEPGNAADLVRCLRECRQSQAQPEGPHHRLALLQAQARVQAGAFTPEAEQAALRGLFNGLV